MGNKIEPIDLAALIQRVAARTEAAILRGADFGHYLDQIEEYTKELREVQAWIDSRIEETWEHERSEARNNR